MKRVFLMNAFSGIFQIVVNTGLVLLIIPLFISKMGGRVYGLYALITSIGGLGVFVNFGFNTSLLKYVAEQGKCRESDYEIIIVTSLVAIMAFVLSVIAIGFHSYVLEQVFQLPLEFRTNEVRWFYILCVVAFFFQTVTQMPCAVLDAQQYVYMSNMIQLVVGIINKLLTVAIIIIWPSLVMIGLALTISMLVGFCLVWMLVFRTWGCFDMKGISRSINVITKKHILYSRGIYGSALIGFFYEPLTKILLSRYVGIAEVGFFDIALRLRGLMSSFFERLLYPIVPFLAKISDRTAIRSIIHEIQSKILIVIIPVFCMTFFLTEPIITLWIKKNIDIVSFGVVCVVIPQLISVVFSAAYQFLVVKGYPMHVLLLQLDNVVINILLFICFVPFWGYRGAVLAYGFALLSSVVLCGYFQYKYLRSFAVVTWEQLKNIAWYGGTLVLLSSILHQLITSAWLQVVVICPVVIFSSFILIRIMRLINIDDVQRYFGNDNLLAKSVRYIFIS